MGSAAFADPSMANSAPVGVPGTIRRPRKKSRRGRGHRGIEFEVIEEEASDDDPTPLARNAS